MPSASAGAGAVAARRSQSVGDRLPLGGLHRAQRTPGRAELVRQVVDLDDPAVCARRASSTHRVAAARRGSRASARTSTGPTPTRRSGSRTPVRAARPASPCTSDGRCSRLWARPGNRTVVATRRTIPTTASSAASRSAVSAIGAPVPRRAPRTCATDGDGDSWTAAQDHGRGRPPRRHVRRRTNRDPGAARRPAGPRLPGGAGRAARSGACRCHPPRRARPAHGAVTALASCRSTSSWKCSRSRGHDRHAPNRTVSAASPDVVSGRPRERRDSSRTL